MMLADIASGNVDAADWLFLVAAILFGIATLVALAPGTTGAATPYKQPTDPGPPAHAHKGAWWAAALIPAGLCLVAIALLVL